MLRLASVLIPVLAILLSPVKVMGQEGVPSISEASALRCVFDSGHKFEWNNGEPAGVEASRPDTAVFDQLDREAGHARVVTSDGMADVSVVVFNPVFLSIYGLTFIEVTRSGNVNMTTVWAPDDLHSYRAGSGTYPAAFSHHHAVDIPATGQFPGWCRIEG